MNKTILGAVIVFFLIAAGAVGLKFLLPKFEESRQKATSDAAKTKGKIKIAMDNWIGYFPLRSLEMAKMMRRSGYILECEDDMADYDKRMERLKKGEIDFAVATVDSYLINGALYHYPGTIIMVIDESKGGDAILANKKKIGSLDLLKGKKEIKVAFTPNSPSHHLLKAAADHFDVPALLPAGKMRVETDGSQEARKMLLAGKVDIAACWEPDVSRALDNKNIIKLLGTEDTERLIVDILVVNRAFALENDEVVKLVLNNYFRTLKKYRDNPDILLNQVKKETGLSKDLVTSMLKGVNWANLNENCANWLGISVEGSYGDEGLVDTINATVNILVHAGDFSKSPIPDNDPYILTNSSFIDSLFSKGITGFTVPKHGGVVPATLNSIETKFAHLDTTKWDSLKEVGTLRVEPIVFQQGATDLDIIAKKVIDQAVENLKHYPNFRVVIKGHTGTRGDKEENLRLSQERANAVQRYMKVTYNVDTNRLHATGLGGTKPLARLPGESNRSLSYRLSRVELVLVRQDY